MDGTGMRRIVMVFSLLSAASALCICGCSAGFTSSGEIFIMFFTSEMSCGFFVESIRCFE